MDANNQGTKNPKKVIISAPFHAQSKTDSNVYNQIFNGLKADFNIYLTDLYKLFFHYKYKLMNVKEQSVKSHQLPTYTHNNIHYKILKQEIEIIKPDLIVTFGNVARNAVSIISNTDVRFNNIISKDIIGTGYDFETENIFTKFISLPHPSNATYSSIWKSFLFENNLIDKNKKTIKVDDRIKGTVQLIKSVISE